MPYNKAIKANLGRPYIINGTTTDTVKLVMMSGAEFEVSLKNVESYHDLVREVVKLLKPKKGTIISVIDGERVLSSNNPRVILTDDSLLTLVI